MDRPSRDRRLGRVVTYGLIAGVLVAALADVESWPVTSFTLFSQPRSEISHQLELIVVDAHGDRTRVAPVGTPQSVPNPAQQLQRVRQVEAADRPARVRALLRASDVDPATVVRADIERVTRRLDPDGGPATELQRSVVAEVPL